jgi:hypothetical protein
MGMQPGQAIGRSAGEFPEGGFEAGEGVVVGGGGVWIWIDARASVRFTIARVKLLKVLPEGVGRAQGGTQGGGVGDGD